MFLSFTFFYLSNSANAQDAVYEELYRPQFHFSPASGWIGDPDGLIKYNNLCHLFWWGHATSEDLVYWTEQPYPMKGGDGSFDYYSGSVVVDTANTAGFAEDAMVAIYTMNEYATGKQSQGISYSTDYSSFQFYEENPVLDIGSNNFRDPQVFWDEQTKRWIMVVTLAEERKIQFYSSDNLKEWNYLSDFGAIGAKKSVWEVADLVQLPVNENDAERKWTLIVSIGPNLVQYFVGEFNGTSFLPDAKTSEYIKEGKGIGGEVFEDFEEANYGTWETSGKAFGEAPTIIGSGDIQGFLGNSLVNSFFDSDANTGTLTSPEFTIEKNNINFLISGGNHPGQTSIDLLINDERVFTTTGNNSPVLQWSGWNVEDYLGETARIRITDTYSGGDWGHINVDHIMFSDILMNTKREHALWVDWGSDFYAPRTFRDYDDDSTAIKWLGWMGNYTYANNVPTSWGKGAQSLPRTLTLADDQNLYNLQQQPIEDLSKLRENLVEISDLPINGTEAFSNFNPPGNTYEMEVIFEINEPGDHVGLNLCVGNGQKVTIGYDAATSNVYLDRTRSGNLSFSTQFGNVTSAPVKPGQTQIKLHIFVDQSSVEVFVNDGEAVITSLIFPDPKQRGIEFFSMDGTANLISAKAWELTSIWGIDPSPITGTKKKVKDKKDFQVIPNPVDRADYLLIYSSFFTGSPIDITIIDMQGQTLYHDQAAKTSEGTAEVKTSLRAGIYILKITGNDFNVSKKIIVK